MIRKARQTELCILKDMFWKHISSHTEYISHGEMQMGVGEAVVYDDDIYGRPAPEGEKMWMKYIEGKNCSEDAEVMVAEEGGHICGFCVVEIGSDGAERFGVLCDILVKEASRGSGIGKQLYDAAMQWFRDRDIWEIYIESGKRNEAAHEFFRRRGFRHVSDIFRLDLS